MRMVAAGKWVCKVAGGSMHVRVLGRQACGCDRWQQEGEVQGRWACKVAAGMWRASWQQAGG